ncbi:MAG: LacI family DNA-binding transcriptional regulator [Anaerolineales bacterium]|nr:LacI family DNA-binding transcriptional regulator [Anaerolineales bacterium]
MKKNKQSVTIQDVARAAGVSVSTVSRVLNTKEDVSTETQENVLSVIEELGYTYNLAARSMRSNKKNLIGLIMPDIGYPFTVEIMSGVNQAIAESEFDLLVYTTGSFRKIDQVSREKKFVSLLNNSLTDGVIIVLPVAGEFSTKAPIVSIEPLMSSKPSYPSVQTTNYQGAMDAMNYLLELGHRRIGHISGRENLESTYRRLEAYHDALGKRGIPIEEELIVTGDYTTDTGAICARQLLSLDKPPTAIFASNDQTAMGVYQIAQQRGVRIPEDLSLVGFDNITESKYLKLTTVDQFVYKTGLIATQMLIKLINGEELESPIRLIQTQLVIRGSCQALPGIS